MFIRTKTIGGTPYAYLVQNEWTPKGSRQKSTLYLGRIVKLGEVPTVFAPPQGSPEEFLQHMIQGLLIQAGFTKVSDQLYALGETTVDIQKLHVLRKKRPVVIELNEGFLCNLTLKNLFMFKERKFSQDLQQTGLHPGKILAQRIVEAGLKITPEQFILTFEHLVPNADVLLKYLYE